jgi:hypothetical protein
MDSLHGNERSEYYELKKLGGIHYTAFFEQHDTVLKEFLFLE